MDRTRVLFMVLFILLIGITLHHSGIIDHFNKIVNQEDSWVKNHNGYSRTYIETSYRFSVTLLKDPKASSLQIFEGAMKKAAVDRMELVTIEIIRVNDMSSIPGKILKVAKEYKCNTAIINGYSEHKTVKTEAVAM